MNTLSRCIEELKKDSPDIRYILGMLETYLEFSYLATPKLSGIDFPPNNFPTNISMTNHTDGSIMRSDEAITDIERSYATGKTGKVT